MSMYIEIGCSKQAFHWLGQTHPPWIGSHTSIKRVWTHLLLDTLESLIKSAKNIWFLRGPGQSKQKISSYGTNMWNMCIWYTPFEIILKCYANESPFSSKMLGIFFANTLS
jgi:hypothetical protein